MVFGLPPGVLGQRVDEGVQRRGEVNLPEGSNTPTEGSTDFGIILGSFWDHFGIVLGSFWDHFWDHVGIILGAFWEQK